MFSRWLVVRACEHKWQVQSEHTWSMLTLWSCKLVTVTVYLCGGGVTDLCVVKWTQSELKGPVCKMEGAWHLVFRFYIAAFTAKWRLPQLEHLGVFQENVAMRGKSKPYFNILYVSHASVGYLVYEPVGKVEEGHHSTPVDAVSKDAPGHLHEDVLSTVALNLVDQSEGSKRTHESFFNRCCVQNHVWVKESEHFDHCDWWNPVSCSYLMQLTVGARRSCSYHLQSWAAAPPLLWPVDPAARLDVLQGPQSWLGELGPLCLFAQSHTCDNRNYFMKRRSQVLFCTRLKVMFIYVILN